MGLVTSNIDNAANPLVEDLSLTVEDIKYMIENSIIDEKEIMINVSSPIVSCRNRIMIEDYEVDSNYLYLNNKNFELHINMNDVIKIDSGYDYEDPENYFYLLQTDNTEIYIYFCE